MQSSFLHLLFQASVQLRFPAPFLSPSKPRQLPPAHVKRTMQKNKVEKLNADTSWRVATTATAKTTTLWRHSFICGTPNNNNNSNKRRVIIAATQHITHVVVVLFCFFFMLLSSLALCFFSCVLLLSLLLLLAGWLRIYIRHSIVVQKQIYSMYVYITRMLLFTYMQINIWDSPLSWGLLYAIHFGLPTIYSYNNSDCNVNYVHFRQCVRMNEAAIYATCHLPHCHLRHCHFIIIIQNKNVVRCCFI